MSEHRGFERVIRWAFGCVTDPHTRWSSSSRLISFAMTWTLHAYVTTHAAPDWRVVTAIVGGGIVPLLVRARSTQASAVALPWPAHTPPPSSEMP